MPGPVPKRDAERRRRNAPVVPTKKATASSAVKAPAMPRNLHPVAAAWWRALKASAHVEFFEPSDWAAAQLVAHEMTRMLKVEFKAAAFTAVFQAMDSLLTTESARRRARIEVERAAAAAAAARNAGVPVMDDYRDALG